MFPESNNDSFNSHRCLINIALWEVKRRVAIERWVFIVYIDILLLGMDWKQEKKKRTERDAEEKRRIDVVKGNE